MSKLDQAAELLLQSCPNITEAQLKKRFRQLAMECHPDRGGNQDEFVELTQAYEVCLEKIRKATKPGKCQNCHGTGSVILVNGIYSVPMMCPVCKGPRCV